MGLEINVSIDHLGRDEKETEAKITIARVGMPFIVRACIDLPKFLSDNTMRKILEEATSYLSDEVVEAQEEIKAFCEDLKTLNYWNKNQPAYFSITEYVIRVYSPYVWHENNENSNKLSIFFGKTLKEALQKALKVHRKQDNEISELSDENFIRTVKNIERAYAVEDLVDYYRKAKKKKRWLDGRKVLAKL